jgi:hypothetical protein
VCSVFCVFYCIVLCIVVPLPPGTYPLAVNINNNNNKVRHYRCLFGACSWFQIECFSVIINRPVLVFINV